MRTFRVALLLAVLAGDLAAQDLAAPSRWPTDAWVESPPEAQGLSSSDLADALEFARTSSINIHSLLVVRNGVVVLDAYFYPFTREMRHDVASVTKSITSLLVGIAIDERFLVGVEQPAVSTLPDALTRGLDQRKARIRIVDLLAMQSGLDCGLIRGEPELREMMGQPDWVAYALSLPIVTEPGTGFGYCSPNYHLLSAVLTSATGLSALDYARARLFEPLGIDDVAWPADPMGNSHGWGDLQLRPRDMAKIGLMMLHRGRWGDRQILAETWIDGSLTVRANVSENEDYGLGWWLSRSVPTLLEANGRGGQRISVVPALDVVVVMTGGGFEPGDVGRYLLASVRADTALPEDPEAQTRLAEELRLISRPPSPHPVTPSAVAGRISHRVYELEENPLGLRSFSVEFSDSAAAFLRFGLDDGTAIVQPLGLDGLYRLAADPTGAVSAGRAEWTSGGRLQVEFNRLARINRNLLDVEFGTDDIRIVATEPTELGAITLRGTAATISGAAP
jgi:CubicO group peptidase (beta-lactamase class C family)